MLLNMINLIINVSMNKTLKGKQSQYEYFKKMKIN